MAVTMSRLPPHVLPFLVTLACALSGCDDNAPGGGAPEGIVLGPGGCASSAQCAPNHICLHGRCMQRAVGGDSNTTPQASLRATPQTLEFATVPPGVTKTLELVLSNEGTAVVTLNATEIVSNGSPASVGRFSIEPMGAGPFWIRPGRQRSVFVTYEGDGAGPHGARLSITSAAAPIVVELRGL